MLRIKAQPMPTTEQIAARPANFAAEILACNYAKNYTWQFRLCPEDLAKMLTDVRAAERERCAKYLDDNYADKNLATICDDICNMPEDTMHVHSHHTFLIN